MRSLALVNKLSKLHAVYTVKPVRNHHSRDQMIVISVDRWSVY